MPALVYSTPSGDPQELQLDKETITIGRQAGNDIVLADPLVSRKHCVLSKKAERWVINDLGSTYGSFVNDERVDGERPLSIGDRLRIGNTPMRFLEADSGVVVTQAPSGIEDTGSVSLSATLGEARALADQLRTRLLGGPAKASDEAPAEIAANLVELIAETQAAFAAVEQTQRLTQTLGEVGKALAHIPDLDTVLRLTMDLAIRALRADRGFILLEENGILSTKISRNMGDTRGISTSIAEKVFQECRPVLTTDAQADPRFNTAHSVMMNAIRAVMCVPLEIAAKDAGERSGTTAIGAIYVDGSPGNRMFNERGLEFLAGFANQAAIAIQSARLAEKSAHEEKMRRELERYFSEAVVNEILRRGGKLGGESRLLTVLFTDIRGFTSLLERLQPAEAVEMLNDYFSEIVDELLAQGATLDKFTGDGVMAFWNAPTEQADHATRAVRAALRIQARIPALLQRWRSEGRSFSQAVGDLATGIGINTGEAVVGNIGSARRVDYTAIGDAVNLSARLQGLARGGDVLVTESTRALLGGGARVEPLPPAALKGKTAAIPIFRVIDLPDS